MESLQAFRAGFPVSRCRRVRAGLNPAVGRRAVPGADSDEEAHALPISPMSRFRRTTARWCAHLPVGQVHLRRRRRDRAVLSGPPRGFYYSRPHPRQLENALAEMQGGDAVCLPGRGWPQSRPPDRALRQGVSCTSPRCTSPRSLIRRVLGRFGVTSSLLSIDDLAGLERRARGAPVRVIVFESPTNPVLKVADIAGITGLARRHGALTLLDNTLAGPQPRRASTSISTCTA